MAYVLCNRISFFVINEYTFREQSINQRSHANLKQYFMLFLKLILRCCCIDIQDNAFETTVASTTSYVHETSDSTSSVNKFKPQQTLMENVTKVATDASSSITTVPTVHEDLKVSTSFPTDDALSPSSTDQGIYLLILYL